MLCILAVFVPSFFMQGAPREMFAPLSLAVGFSMIASYLLSSTFVPVLSVWLLRHRQAPAHAGTSAPGTRFRRLRNALIKLGWKNPRLASPREIYARLLQGVVGLRWIVTPAYLVICGLVIWLTAGRLGTEIFPTFDAGEFRLRLRAPDGTHIDKTEQIALQTLDIVEQEVGAENVAITLGYVGTIPASFPINAVYQFSRGPEEAILRIALKRDSGISTEQMKEVLRTRLRERLPDVRFSFEPADIVSEVMSFGSPTPIEVAVRGGTIAENRAFLKKIEQGLDRYRRSTGVAMHDELPLLMTATELLGLLARRHVGAVEVTQAFLDRIERLDRRINSYITVTADAALREARRLDRARGRRGALHGLPIAMKDLCATKGVRTTAGSKILANWVPQFDATIVERCRAAGAVLLGKLNMHELAFGVTTNNPHYGPTRNPWDVERIPGGSSGGSGAAVAASLCAGAFGTDTGGSIRIPAAALRSGGIEADVRTGESIRCRPLELVARSRRSARQDGRRYSSAPGRLGRP